MDLTFDAVKELRQLGCQNNDSTFVNHVRYCIKVSLDSSHCLVSSQLTSLCFLDGVSSGKLITQCIPN